jgi:ABC-2 type transport system permease protein
MSKILLVIRQEVINTLTRRSFLLAAFGVPVISSLIILGLSVANRRAPDAVASVFAAAPPAGEERQGYVDPGGLIGTLPESLEGSLEAFPDAASAGRALDAGQIEGYYLIPADYVHSGEIIYVRPDFNPLSAFDQQAVIRPLLVASLLGGDEDLAARIDQPLALEITVREPAASRDDEHPLAFYLPYGVTMLYYIAILMSASFLLSSLTKEKENRVLEILLLSAQPRQLLTGKIVGLGLMGLLQNILWLGTGYALLRLSGRTLAVPEAFQLPPAFLAWGIVFFLLGYGLYASLMAAVGALVPNLREASQATFVVILPMLVPMMLVSVLVEQPNGALATGLSLFPLTAPVAMMARLAATPVPVPQLLLSAGLLVATIILLVRSVARLFQAQVLLSGQPFSLGRLFGALAARR